MFKSENMDSIAFVVTSAPYGKEDAFRGIYLPFATVRHRVVTFLLLFGDGVYSALENQKAKLIEYPDVSQLIRNIITLGGKVCASKSSCEARGIEKDELIKGVQLATDFDMAMVLVQVEGNIVF